jgi:hypothetical protein
MIYSETFTVYFQHFSRGHHAINWDAQHSTI